MGKKERKRERETTLALGHEINCSNYMELVFIYGCSARKKRRDKQVMKLIDDNYMELMSMDAVWWTKRGQLQSSK